MICKNCKFVIIKTVNILQVNTFHANSFQTAHLLHSLIHSASACHLCPIFLALFSQINHFLLHVQAVNALTLRIFLQRFGINNHLLKINIRLPVFFLCAKFLEYRYRNAREHKNGGKMGHRDNEIFDGHWHSGGTGGEEDVERREWIPTGGGAEQETQKK